MTAVVRFRTPVGDCAVAVEHVLEVRLAAGITPLPAPRPSVAGMIEAGEDAITVLNVLGSSGGHVIVVEDGDLRFGLLVDEVTGVVQIPDADVGPPPPGQDRAVVAGIVNGDNGLILLLDLTVLRGRLVG